MQMGSGDHPNMSNWFFPMMMMHHDHHQHQPPPPLLPSSPQNPNNAMTHFLSHQEQLNHHGSSPVMLQDSTITSTGYYFMDNNGGSEERCSLKANIMAHPHYPKLLAAYVNCQKIGAPPEVVMKLDEACRSATREIGRATGFFGEDPALDQFMEAYCEMLSKYEQELAKPFKEAMFFLSRIECQFKAITVASAAARGEAMEKNGSSEDLNMNTSFIDPCAEDGELKGQILRKYGGYLGDLKQGLMRKRKKGKLPKEARQQLLEWWSQHYKWPYPSEAQKTALAVSTGLELKQINNWFINQRKRHWKPSEDMHFVQLEIPHCYLDNTPYPMDISPVLT